MKKLFVLTSILAVLIGCTKEKQLIEMSVIEDSEKQAPALTFNLNINHSGLDTPDTKAVKSGWEAGDKVFVFFSTVTAPKHLELTYDGTDWTATEMNGKDPGSIGLTEDGTMTAVYLPFGNDAIVKTKSGRFAFDQTDYSYYLSCVNVPYALSGTEVSGTLDMTVPDGFVQFFFTDADAVDGNTLLREAHITPKAVTGVNADGTLVIESKAEGTQMPGFVYGAGDTKGYLFSGVLADGAIGVNTDYHFNMVVGATSKVLEGTKTLHSGTVGNYAHRAIKFPALSSWSDGSDEVIEFADANIKAKVIEAFDTNADGELSYAEAAIPTSIADVFGSAKNYTSFNEFQYFTGVTSILDNQFKEWIIKTIHLPANIVSIGESTFMKCSLLSSITIPDSVTSIGTDAFRDCSSLTSITIPDGVTRIERSTFAGCGSLTSITIPNGVTQIGNSAFRDCSSLTSFTIPDSVTSIGTYAFQGCGSLTSITIPDGVTRIEAQLFKDCSSLTSITIPDSVNTIRGAAFQDCSSLTSITIPDGVTRIESYTFDGCGSLTSITIPNGVTHIGDSAFSGCSSLTSITIPSGVTHIGRWAFSSCSSLTSITVLPVLPPNTGEYMFMSDDGLIIYVPEDSVDAYKASTYWSEYADRIQAIP